MTGPDDTVPQDVLTLLDRIDRLATHTDLADGGIKRVYLSSQHAAVNELVAGWMREAGMVAWQDAAGNLCGRIEGAEDGLPALVLGSHLDTVPDAGRWDGILGVVSAITVAARLRPLAATLPFAVEVVAFADEEGTRFGRALLGSRAFAGTWDDAWWDLTDADGTRLDDAFRAFGLAPERIGEAARSSASLAGYLEVHIEQAPALEDAGVAVGVVRAIAGARRFAIEVTGHSGHSATPPALRRDALIGVSACVLAIESIARQRGVVATMGHVAVQPDATNVIAGRAELSLDLRAECDADRDAAWAEMHNALTGLCRERGLGYGVTETHSAPAVTCDAALRDAVGVGVRSTGVAEPLLLLSIAGHDGMAVAAKTGIGMIFVRCRGGVSHHPDEHVAPLDAAAGVDALQAAVLALAHPADGTTNGRKVVIAP